MNSVVFFRRAAWTLFAAVLLVFHFNCPGASYTNGIYAEFNTSMGSYTCRLEYAIAPKTVANFMGLATGQRGWLDLPSGLVKTNPFYNGLTYHRVIAGFMEQCGSPNGQGTDGPGYQFADEFTSLHHDSFGVLSMANSGPDSNGAQWFITVAPNAGLDNTYSAFGRLYGGSNVVYAINHVATNPTNDKPLVNVVLQSVVIQRVGTAAQAFDINAQGLPVVTNLHLNIGWSGTNLLMGFSNQLYADNRVCFSSNLLNWTASPLGITVASPFFTALLLSPSGPGQFFTMAQIQYPPIIYTPRTVANRTINLSFSTAPAPFTGTTLTLTLDGSGGSGTYLWSGGGANYAFYNWVQDPYRGRFYPLQLLGIPSPYTFLQVHLDFDTATNGTFKGVFTGFPPDGSGAIAGPFTASP